MAATLSQVLVKEENGVKTFYVYGLGLLGEEKDGEYRSYHFDFRGSTVALTDKIGKVVQRFQYGPYGELVKGEVSVTPFLFNGKFGVMSDDNGLYYMRARFYSAAMKRFINMDVLLGNVGEGQTLNRFAFVTGKVVSFIDPNGLDPITAFYPNATQMETGATYIKLYQIGREVETQVQDYILELVEEGILPRPHRNTPRDAVRHCTAACTISLRVGRENAEFMQDVWEFMGSVWENSTAQDLAMDYHNNWCGFNRAKTGGATSLRECGKLCLMELQNSHLIAQMTLEDKFWPTFLIGVMSRLSWRMKILLSE